MVKVVSGKHDFQNGSDPAEEELFMKETEKYP